MSRPVLDDCVIDVCVFASDCVCLCANLSYLGQAECWSFVGTLVSELICCSAEGLY